MLFCRMPAQHAKKSTPSILLYGVDFTSAPRSKKGITIASGYLLSDTFELQSLTTLFNFADFSAWLNQEGPWLGGFDFPFSLPRELVAQLEWPLTWPELMQHLSSITRAELRETFKAVCDARPVGSKFIHRATDIPAGSSSPMKWVNPPVAYMLHAGAPLLHQAGVSIPKVVQGDKNRIALEAYPGMVARSITKASYKNDAPAMQTPERRAARKEIVRTIEQGDYPFAIKLDAGKHKQTLINDGSGDYLDAVLCAIMAAWAYQRRAQDYGLPTNTDALEGWIVGA